MAKSLRASDWLCVGNFNELRLALTSGNTYLRTKIWAQDDHLKWLSKLENRRKFRAEVGAVAPGILRVFRLSRLPDDRQYPSHPDYDKYQEELRSALRMKS